MTTVKQTINLTSMLLSPNKEASIPDINKIYQWIVPDINISFEDMLNSKFYIVDDINYSFYITVGTGIYCNRAGETVIWVSDLELNNKSVSTITILENNNKVIKNVGPEPLESNQQNAVWIFHDIDPDQSSIGCRVATCTQVGFDTQAYCTFELGDSRTRPGYNNMNLVIPSNQKITKINLNNWINLEGTDYGGFPPLFIGVDIDFNYRTCSSTDLKPFSSCMQYCTTKNVGTGKLPSECFDIMKQYCFSQNNNKYNFITDDNCYSYFSQYYEENPRDIPIVDDDVYKSFKTMCSTYNVDDIKGDMNVQKICGCYMSDDIMNNFEASLKLGLGASAKTILQSYDIGCFFTPFCGQTNLLTYKKTCPTNICIENTNIGGDGKIEGNVNVKQECIIQPSETTDKTDTTDDKEKGKSFFAKYKIPIIGGISGLLLLFIIIIVIISKSKKNK
jgi:hypothetical protein